MLAALALLSLSVQTSSLDTAYVLGGVMRAGRHPIPSDPVIEALVKGTWQPPTDWRQIKANAEGWFEDRTLRSAYVHIPVEWSRDETVLLDAAGHTMVYVNGVPRGGDPYGYGYMTLPVRLRAGRNNLLFVSGRGRIRAAIKPISKPVEFDVRDLTTPDLLPSDKGLMDAAVVVRNAGPDPLNDLWIEAIAPDGKARKERVGALLGETIRKAPFRFPAIRATGDTARLKLRLIRQSKVLDEQEIPLRLRGEKQTYKRTFVSGIDGSVQYYVVNPAQKPSRSNHLVLTVHGASVEATSQADAYASKDDITIVAATNRRPYGFDWEDWGRMDALEVLSIAKKTIPHNPHSVHLTGHSMGGHGAWYLGTLYPDLFASVSPAAGWISFWSYGGGWNPENPTPPEALLRRSMNASDVLARLSNTLAQGVYVLHGDADESVPVSEARRMREELTKLEHPDFGYHEVKGGSHWWSNESVDWPGIFDLVRRRRLDPDPEQIDFTTPNPAVSSKAWWAQVLQQQVPLEPSRIQLVRKPGMGQLVEISGSTQNVRALELTLPKPVIASQVTLDGQKIALQGFGDRARQVRLIRNGLLWTSAKPASRWVPAFRASYEDDPPEIFAGGIPVERPVALPTLPTLKDAFNNRMAFVFGTGGTPEENEWARNKARFDAESWYYRGNGSVDVVPDTLAARYPRRNLVLYGNSATNKAWRSVVADPFLTVKDTAKVGDREARGNIAVAAVLPGQGRPLVAIIGGTGIEGMRRTDRLPILGAGTGYPSWLLVDGEGIVGAGFGIRYDPTQSAWR
ncbi:MAG TPA: alpha/beta hydrolase-fold protein [Fimbriimonas sp.]